MALRWGLFFAIIVLAVTAVTALWTGFSRDMLKAVATFAIISLAVFALYALTKRA